LDDGMRKVLKERLDNGKGAWEFDERGTRTFPDEVRAHMEARGVKFGPDGYPANHKQSKRATDLLNTIDQATKGRKRQGNPNHRIADEPTKAQNLKAGGKSRNRRAMDAQNPDSNWHGGFKEVMKGRLDNGKGAWDYDENGNKKFPAEARAHMEAHGIDFGPDGYPAEQRDSKRVTDRLNKIDKSKYGKNLDVKWHNGFKDVMKGRLSNGKGAWDSDKNGKKIFPAEVRAHMEANGIEFGPDGYPADKEQSKRVTERLNVIDEAKQRGNRLGKPNHRSV